MKKILIATSCAITLCFTSCATKQAPQADSQLEAPETEASETADAAENASEENTENSEASQTDETAEGSTEEDAAATDVEADSDTALTSEDFPEPETIYEPEIITLEPVEEAEASENAPASEEVENEEPPEITIPNSNESNEAENQADVSDGEAGTPDADNTDTDNVEDITANDVIIVSNPDTDGISGGIDITDEDDSDVSLDELEKDITPSRSVTLKKFEYLDVTYPGTGWIYMGLTDNSKDLAYFGRKLGTKDTKFSLQARAAGTKIIHFYRNDPLTGQYLDDYVEVKILAENGSNKTHIEAPEYKLPVQKKEKPVKKTEEALEEVTETAPETKEPAQPAAKSAKAPAAATTATTPAAQATPAATAPTAATRSDATPAATSATKQTASTPASTNQPDTTTPAVTQTTANPDSLLQEAQLLYNEKEYKTALAKLNQFFEYSTDNRDEALYLKGQILEAKSEIRDIKGAIDAYTTLTKNYPASKLWDSANKRVIYLKRFYLEVR